MALESSTTIKGLVASNPVGAADPKRDGDNHIRMIKDVLQRAFPDMDYLIAGKDDSGIANAIQLTFTTTAPSAYAKYMLVYFVAANANTGATTLQINSLGAKSLVDWAGNALASGALQAGRAYLAVYDGTQFRMLGFLGGTADTEVPTNALLKATVRGFTKQQYHTQGTLTDGATINWDLDTAPQAKVTVALTGRTLANPTNMKAGGWYSLLVTGAGSITTFGSAYKWPFGGGAPTLTANQTHIITFYSDGTSMFGVAVTDFQ